MLWGIKVQTFLCYVIGMYFTKYSLQYSVEKDFLKGTVSGGLLILYNEAHFEMENFEEKRNVSSSLFKEQGYDWHNKLRRRGFLTLTLQTKGKGRVITIVNTHPNALPNGATDIHRTLQFRQVVSWCDAMDGELRKMMAMEGRNSIVCGDFNVHGKTAELKTLTDANFIDSVKEGNWMHLSLSSVSPHLH